MSRIRAFEPEPLFLSYGIRRYAFGARLIADRLGKPDLPAGDVAETWEASDHDDEPAVVLDGQQRGRRLRELVRAFPDQVVGPGWGGPHLPLLVKFLDASHRLHVHVHPDAAAARERYGAPNGKDEAWHVLWAEPGASVLVGVREGVDGERLRAACRARQRRRPVALPGRGRRHRAGSGRRAAHLRARHADPRGAADQRPVRQCHARRRLRSASGPGGLGGGYRGGAGASPGRSSRSREKAASRR